ncbi:MAG: phosphonate C-P lyase system protein PhnH [Roseovarius sp.]|nr:phosphonate C-P lyase system protein PhnH [Roseovarius sp.]
MRAEAMEGGFADPSTASAHAFRAIMEAMARPGRIESVKGAVPPPPMSPAAGAVVLTLCDHDTPLHLAAGFDTPETRAWVTFHTGAPVAAADAVAFALGDWDGLLPLSQYRRGNPEYPDQSATLIVELAGLSTDGATLRGPGIRDEAQLSLPETRAFRENAQTFPLGLDFLFTCGGRLAALPRSTEVL